ncbi:MAG: HD-GYP domain-containing protein [Deltaproteobacteria bacterium]|nr:HD-GYP domain-containing protein [Deltaproteobacteria bacterium]
MGRRLTFSFTLFGLVIGYAVFIFLAVSSTNTFIKLASDSVRQYLDSVSKENISNNQGELLKIIDQRMTNIMSSAKALQVIFPPVKVDLYFQDDGHWQHTYMDAQGAIKSEIITDKVFAHSLEKAKKNRVMTSSRLFYGVEDTVNVKINISPKTDGYTHIISFDIQRIGFLKILQDNIYKAVLFFIVLLFISHTLGQLFSIWLARPIEKLSQEAETIASGQYERRFTTGRKDEIGMLAEALNTMASRIIDGTRERENILIGILIALTRAIDAKSPWTAGHSERVTKFTEAIGHGLLLNDDQMRVMSISAILHDIGKIAVPEQILDKPGKLTDEEFEIVKKHPLTGADIISSIPSYETILPGILHHHERWDGTGYPKGVKGKDIPLFARIICIADVYDALTEDRPYRKAWTQEQTLKFFDDQKEKMFDPELVDIFLKLLENKKAFEKTIR